MSINSNYTDVIDYELDSVAIKGGNTSLAKFDNNIYYNFIDGVMKYNSISNDFKKDTLLSNISRKEIFYGIIRNDLDGKLWLFSENYLHYVYKDLVTGNKKVNSLVFPDELRRTVFENVSKIDKSTYILGTNNGYISLDLENYSLIPPKVQVNKIESFKLNESPNSINKNEFIQLNFDSNNLNFYPSVSNYQKFQPITFEYLLDGYINEWTETSETPIITFNNLKPGSYQFKVRAKIGALYSENTESISFSVERPWYFSNFMIANYFLVFAILFFFLNRSYEKYYQEKEEKMMRINKSKLELIEFEKKQALMAVENTKLQTDIESKNRELAVSTMSMIKKNQFLSKIKSDLKKTDNPDKIFSVIKMIDRNLNINDVDQGLITFDDGISESVSETAFNASLNQLSGPTESPFGPSLIYVNEIVSEKEIKIEEIKDQIIIDIQKDKAKDKVYSLYGEIEDLRAEGKTLEEIAEEKSLSIESFKNINDVGQRIDGSIIKNPSLEELINLIFLNDVDEDLEPYEDSEGNLNFFRIDNINYSQQIPLNEAMENIKLSILENKSIENVKTKSKEIFDRLKEYNNNLDFISDENDLAIATSGILSRTSSNEIFTSNALSEIFKTEKGSSFIVNAAIGNSIVIGKVSNIDLLEKTEERMEAINEINKSRLENDLIVSLAEEHQKELSSEIFLDRLNLLFENQEAEGSF